MRKKQVNKVIYLATGNAHKLSEFSQMLENSGWVLKSATDLGGMPEVDENAETFTGNAFLKASALKKIAPKDAYVLADDSGIVVDALNGAPGVHSARYAGVKGANADAENNKKLLANLANVPDNKRTARFVCELAFICPDDTVHSFSGKVEGRINHGEKGTGGFGYDPLFFCAEFGCTTAEMPAEKKNEISHRGKALRKLLEFLKTL